MYQSHTIALKDYPEAKRLILAADPTYKKLKAYIVVSEKCTLSGTYWSGGSRSQYAAVDMATMQAKDADSYQGRTLGNPEAYGGAATPTVEIPEGIAIICTGISDGKTQTAFININPANAAKLLPNYA
mgnify:CR=1 FL=1